MDSGKLYNKISKKLFEAIKKSERIDDSLNGANKKNMFYIAVPMNEYYDFRDGCVILKCDSFVGNTNRYVKYFERIYLMLNEEGMYSNKKLYIDKNSFSLSGSEVILNNHEEKLCKLLFNLIKKLS